MLKRIHNFIFSHKPALDHLVCIVAVPDRIKAEMMQTSLQDADIPCYIFYDNGGWHSSTTRYEGGLRLMVPSDMLQAAREHMTRFME